MIEIRRLRKAYGGHDVLRGVDLSLPPGRVTGLVGVNGAGKTTLLRCLCGYEAYDGPDIVGVDELRTRLGYLPTTPPFPSYVTGREWLRLALRARRLSVPDLDAANAFALPLDEYASAYSTGMAKKLAFTGLMLQDNDVFVLDEPFNGVDLAGNTIISAAVERLRARGATVLVTSHLLEALATICDRVAVLEAGRIGEMVGADGVGALAGRLGGVGAGAALRAWGLDG